MDKQAFFSAIRGDLFDGALKPGQVYNVETLLDAIDAADWPLSYAAYALATSHYETARWTTLKEIGRPAYFHRMYDKAGDRPKVAAQLGNTQPGDGARFPGRGYVQLTGRRNMRNAGRHVGVDLEKDPDRAAEPTLAARILIWGMETGAYTGKANRDYLDKSPPDYAGARRIINGTDKAQTIASYAKVFERALRAAGYGSEVAKPAVTANNSPSPRSPEIAPDIMPEINIGQPRNDGLHQAPASEGFWSRFFTGFWKRLTP